MTWLKAWTGRFLRWEHNLRRPQTDPSVSRSSTMPPVRPSPGSGNARTPNPKKRASTKKAEEAMTVPRQLEIHPDSRHLANPALKKATRKLAKELKKEGDSLELRVPRREPAGTPVSRPKAQRFPRKSPTKRSKKPSEGKDP